jgi:cytochrome c553
MPHEILSRFFLLALAIGALCLAAAAGKASNTVDSLTQSASIGDSVAGKKNLQSLLCQECHGEDGISISNFARHLAGQYARYIVKQVHDFQTGARDNPTMTMMAENH